MNCGLKAYQSKWSRNIEVYGVKCRYIQSSLNGQVSIKLEKVVKHQTKNMEITKVWIIEIHIRPIDLATIMCLWVSSAKDRCISLVLGTLFSSLGLLLLTYLSIDKIINHTYGIANRPAFILAFPWLSSVYSSCSLRGFWVR